MRRNLPAAAVGVFAATLCVTPAWAQKHGGVLKLYTLDSPASMSILEETTVFAQRPVMGVFNNLVMFDQHVKQNSLQSIVPDLATGWSWNEDGTELTFPLREGVTWHDGKPFTAKDVRCTWDMLTGKIERKAAHQPSQGVVSQPRRDHDQRRSRGHLPSQATAAVIHRAPRFRLFRGLSLPCCGARYAQAPDRHRPLQIRRIQTERGDQGDQKPRLLEERPALSRRHRIYDHP
jgi:peptide/nickel transport system substrate-binding protein